jgi:uncharacterized protein
MSTLQTKLPSSFTKADNKLNKLLSAQEKLVRQTPFYQLSPKKKRKFCANNKMIGTLSYQCYQKLKKIPLNATRAAGYLYLSFEVCNTKALEEFRQISLSNKNTPPPPVDDSKETLFYLGLSYLLDIGINTKGTLIALDLIKKSAAQDCTKAQYLMGLIYEAGLGLVQDYQKAHDYYSLAAYKGHSGAQTNLGYLYQCGHGVPQDSKKALDLYKKASDKGNGFASYNLGILYFDGIGVSNDHKKAFTHIKIAAKQGIANAQTLLAKMYKSGLGTKQHHKKSFKYYLLAANQGKACAQDNLGILYFKKKNYVKAFNWFQLAAKSGDVNANNNLGLLYLSGRGVSRDYKKAFNHFQFSAIKGHVSAQYNLGRLHYKGLGTVKNNKLAARWLRLASIEQHEYALNELKKSTGIHCKFHWYIHNNELAKLVRLINENPILLDELSFFEFRQITNDDKALMRIRGIIERLEKKPNHAIDLNLTYIKLVSKLTNLYGSQSSIVSTPYDENIQYCYNRIQWSKLNQAHAEHMLNIIIKNHSRKIISTNHASRYLTKCIWCLNTLDLKRVNFKQLEKMTMILIKAIYGETPGLKISAPTMKKLLLLASIYENNKKPAMSTINELLGEDFLQTLEDRKGPGFFETNKPKHEGVEHFESPKHNKCSISDNLGADPCSSQSANFTF